jgi:hypothetical protein
LTPPLIARFIDAFGEEISKKQRGEADGYRRYLEQAREQVEALGLDAGVLARL